MTRHLVTTRTKVSCLVLLGVIVVIVIEIVSNRIKSDTRRFCFPQVNLFFPVPPKCSEHVTSRSLSTIRGHDPSFESSQGSS